MREYTVEIIETVTNIITVNASSRKQAYLMAVYAFQLSDGGTYFADSEVHDVLIDGESTEVIDGTL